VPNIERNGNHGGAVSNHQLSSKIDININNNNSNSKEGSGSAIYTNKSVIS